MDAQNTTNGKRTQSENVARRRDRVFELVVIDGHDDASEVAAILTAEDTLQSKSRASALRLVQADMKRIRDASEARRYLSRRLFAMREFRRIATDDSEVQLDVVTPKGDTVTLTKPRWPPGVRVRALHNFTQEAEMIARVMFIDVTGKRKQSGSEKTTRHKGCVPVDLSELSEPEQEEVRKAMRDFPGGDGGEDSGVPN